MTALCALLVGAPLADDGPATNQRGARCFGLGGMKCSLNRLRIMPIHIGYHMPAIGLKALRGIVSKPTLDLSIDRDTIIVVNGDQLTEAQCARQRAGFMGHPFHQAAIA